jgi:23S rRNA (cytidine1920-2'-O)/16S rRNA (cytidine1409-2'-O)-methyltransferase
MAKIRLDVLVTQRGLADSRSKAQALIMAGKVRVNGQVATKAGTPTPADAELSVEADLPYVSRGGLKLAGALDAFQVSPAGLVCADVGASTGGFTDVLLQRDAARVYAIDVGYGQLAWKLRQDSRVVVMERTNARHLALLPEPVAFVTIDASFISLRLLLPAVVKWLAQPAHVVALVKPQFEAGKSQVGKGGVVKERQVHLEVLQNSVQYAQQAQLAVLGITTSPITGPAGNHEFLLHMGHHLAPSPEFDVERAILRNLAMLYDTP